MINCVLSDSPSQVEKCKVEIVYPRMPLQVWKLQVNHRKQILQSPMVYAPTALPLTPQQTTVAHGEFPMVT